MANDTFPDPSRPTLNTADAKLVDLVDRVGPFGSLFLGPGADLRARAQIAMDAVPVPAPHAGALLAAVADSQARSQVVITDGADVWRFVLEDPLALDLARFEDIPSLGPIVEASQVTLPHVVVTVEDDVYGITSFSTVDSEPDTEAPVTEPSILEALDHLLETLRRSDAPLVALIGTTEATAELQGQVQSALPLVRCHAYPTDDIDRDLLKIADEVVRDAAAMAAERRTHELAHFRQARLAAQTQEGIAVLGAIEAGEAQRLLVHDDPAILSEPGVARLADRAIVAAIRAGVPITMIPDVSQDRGPSGGLGVITKGHGSAVSSAQADPRLAGDVRLDA